MNLVVSLLLFGLALTAASGYAGCPSHLPKNVIQRQSRDKCYAFFTKEYIGFFNARKRCKTFGGILALPKTKRINDYLRWLLKSVLRTNKRFWIGLTDIEAETRYKWEDGTYLNFGKQFHNFGRGEGPGNNLIQRHWEDCIALDPSGTWHDYRCWTSWIGPLIKLNGDLNFICEFNVPKTTRKPKPRTTTTTTTSTTTTTTTTIPTSLSTTDTTTTSTTTPNLTAISTVDTHGNQSTSRLTTPSTTDSNFTTAFYENTTLKLTKEPTTGSNHTTTTNEGTAILTTPEIEQSTTVSPTNQDTSILTTPQIAQNTTASTTNQSTSTQTIPTASPLTTGCPGANCGLDCGLDGFKIDPKTLCFLCECDN